MVELGSEPLGLKLKRQPSRSNVALTLHLLTRVRAAGVSTSRVGATRPERLSAFFSAFLAFFSAFCYPNRYPDSSP
jgi:hypothetical protein